jgi:hypothetical protein
VVSATTVTNHHRAVRQATLGAGLGWLKLMREHSG